jgi:hypothetical protein
MKRADSIGLFWEDVEVIKEVKPPPPKRTPPPRVWEEPGYIPTLGTRLYMPPSATWNEILAAQQRGERFVYDSEIYPNYYLAAFMSVKTGKSIYFEMTPERGLDIVRLKWMLENCLTIGFNSATFDNTIALMAVEGFDLEQLNRAVSMLINGKDSMQSWLVLRSFDLRTPKHWNHIDLYNVAPLDASLKIYGGRLHVPRMQDLPFKFNTHLSTMQMDVVRDYCIGSDLVSTAYLYKELEPNIDLREKMSLQFGTDLRSKSDAQVAEAVIVHELTRINFVKPERTEIQPGTSYHYKVPAFLKFETPLMQDVLEVVRNALFVVQEHGGVATPDSIECLSIPIAGAVYKMGIGGLHSQETTVAHVANEEFLLVDRDVASYYPSIILNLGLYPQHLGTSFLTVYKMLVDRRLEAKAKADDKSLTEKERAAWKVIADALKITINGSFGKLGNKYSVLYSPDLLTQVTMTGQLSLLMLVERAELAGFTVCSGNTDGLFFKIARSRRAEFEALVAQWEKETGFKTEETEYKAMYARDVNNYIAVKPDGKTKVKGTYAEKGSALNSVLSKNPEALICSDAVIALLTKGIPIVDTIAKCKDIRRFVTVRTVKGGAVKDGRYLGKAVRWYYSNDGNASEMVYAMSGNKVPRSEGAKPALDLPAQFPADVDAEWYVREATEILREIAFLPPADVSASQPTE